MPSPWAQENTDEATSRGGCGSTLAAGAPTLTCGGPNLSGLRFTHSCGARLQIASAPAPAAPPEAAAIPTSIAAGRYQVRRFLAEGSRERVYLTHAFLLVSGWLFVGREREMSELRVGLEDARSELGRLCMLVGEPGVGKTRMANELATYAPLGGARVHTARCYGHKGAPSRWPSSQVIGAYVHDWK